MQFNYPDGGTDLVHTDTHNPDMIRSGRVIGTDLSGQRTPLFERQSYRLGVGNTARSVF